MPQFTVGRRTVAQRRIAPAGQSVERFNQTTWGQQIIQQQAAIQAQCGYTATDTSSDAAITAWNAGHPNCPPIPLPIRTIVPVGGFQTTNNTPSGTTPIVYPPSSGPNYLLWGAVGVVGLGAAYLLLTRK